MGLRETADKVVELMSSVDFVYVLTHTDRDSIDKLLGMVVTDLETLESEKEPQEVTDEDILVVLDSLNMCKRFLLELPITERITELVKAICLVAHNWNTNVGNNSTIHKDVRFINAAIDQHYTIASAIEILKRVLDRAERSYLNYDNINSISAHYLSVLEQLGKEDLCDSECGGECEENCSI